MKIKRYHPSPEFIEAINEVAPFIRVAAAEVATKELGYEVDPNTLPEVKFVDNERTRRELQRSRPWTTPLVVATRPTPIGQSIEKVLIHPNSLVRRTLDVMNHFGGEEKAIEMYTRLHGVSREKAQVSLLENSACSLIAEETLRVLPGIDPHSKISREVIDLALDRWNPESR